MKLKIHAKIVNFMSYPSHAYFKACNVETFNIRNATHDLRKVTCKNCQNFFRKLIKKHWNVQAD